MDKPLALDLCCGKGGWTIGLLAAGWDVIGVDIEKWDGYPKEAEFCQTDVRMVRDLAIVDNSVARKIQLVVASPPCQEFSYRSFPFKRCRELAANVPPDTSIWRACERIAKECSAPLVLENVRGAQKYMGKAKAHYGSFYLWGNVPAMLPIGKATKNMSQNYVRVGNSGLTSREVYKNGRAYSSKSKERKEWSANAAMIPFELARWIGECFKPEVQIEGIR